MHADLQQLCTMPVPCPGLDVVYLTDGWSTHFPIELVWYAPGMQLMK